MTRLLSITLSIFAAGSSMLPSGCCLLEMAGECHVHSHDMIDDDGDAGAQVSPDSQHQCIKLTGDGIAARAQHAPSVDLRREHLLPCEALARVLCEEQITARYIFDRRTFLNALDSPLFLTACSFLI